MAKKEAPVMLQVGDREVRITSPSKLYFPAANLTKLDLVQYYLDLAEGAVRAIHSRPMVLKRYVKGITLGQVAVHLQQAPVTPRATR